MPVRKEDMITHHGRRGTDSRTGCLFLGFVVGVLLIVALIAVISVTPH